MMKLLLGAVVLAAASSGSTGARAASIYGSAAILTNRPCTQPASTTCVLGSRTFTQFAGGMSTGFSTSASNMNGQGASASGAVEFGEGYLPILHAASQSGAASRSGGNIAGFRSFTYEGDASIDFALAGALDFTSSGNMYGGETAGEGAINVLLSIVPLSALAQFTPNSTGQDIVNSNVPFMDCSGGAIASTGYTSIGTGPGAHVANLSLSQNCQGGAITLNHGDTFAIVATLQSTSNRSGFADASNTFKVQYDGVKSVYTASGQSVGAAFLLNAIDGTVPEPATWAMMLLGFALTGAALRQARADRAIVRAG